MCVLADDVGADTGKLVTTEELRDARPHGPGPGQCDGGCKCTIFPAQVGAQDVLDALEVLRGQEGQEFLFEQEKAVERWPVGS